MTVKEKVELAQKGTKEERRILIGDMNRMVSLAVLRCESITMSELEQICAMRHLAVELYQEIAATREWMTQAQDPARHGQQSGRPAHRSPCR